MKIMIVKGINNWWIEIIAANGTLMFQSKRMYANRRNAREAAQLVKKQIGKAKVVME
jgi:uncharacterized protein YegP (UPF0339 family)